MFIVKDNFGVILDTQGKLTILDFNNDPISIVSAFSDTYSSINISDGYAAAVGKKGVVHLWDFRQGGKPKTFELTRDYNVQKIVILILRK